MILDFNFAEDTLIFRDKATTSAKAGDGDGDGAADDVIIDVWIAADPLRPGLLDHSKVVLVDVTLADYEAHPNSVLFDTSQLPPFITG